jgi:hypothetical protein
MKTVGQVRTTIAQRLHGTTLDNLGDFYELCNGAAEKVLTRIDPQETVRKTPLTSPVYSRIYDYLLPSDFKAPLDIRPQSDKQNTTDLNRTFTREFENMKRNNQIQIAWVNGDQFLRFSRILDYPVIIDKADSLTENGTWLLTGNANTLSIDTLDYKSGTGSLRALTTANGSIVSVQIKVGNDASNYYTKTLTSAYLTSFTQGWNLLKSQINTMSLVGSVDMTDIGYVEITVTYDTNKTVVFTKVLTLSVDLSGDYFSNGAFFFYVSFDSLTSVTTVKLDNILAVNGTLFDLTYYSNAIFKDATTGEWKQFPTADTDIVMLSPDSYKIFEAELSKIGAQQNQGAMGGFDLGYWQLELEGNYNEGLDSGQKGLYQLYQEKYPSERFEGSSTYFVFDTDIDYYGNDSINGLPRSYYS